MLKVAIFRMVGGRKEYALKSANMDDKLLFESLKDAKDFLRTEGLTEEEIKQCIFEVVDTEG